MSMNLTEQQIVEVLTRLATRTGPDGFVWEYSSAEPDEYKTATARFKYYVRSRDGDGRAPFVFEIFITDSPSEGPHLVVESRQAFAQAALQKLFSAARSSASGFGDDMAEEVLRDIDEHTPF
jgi:hypothetical protein